MIFGRNSNGQLSVLGFVPHPQPTDQFDSAKSRTPLASRQGIGYEPISMRVSALLPIDIRPCICFSVKRMRRHGFAIPNMQHQPRWLHNERYR